MSVLLKGLVHKPDLIARYLHEVHLESLIELTDNDCKSLKNEIFYACVRDFMDRRIDMHGLAMVLSTIWVINEKTYNFFAQTEVEKLCFLAIELEFDLRSTMPVPVKRIMPILDHYFTHRKRQEDL